MKNRSFGFIGGGRVAYILLKALERQNVIPEKIIVSEPDSGCHDRLKNLVNQNITCTKDNKQAAKADIIFLAVHPPAVPAVLDEISAEINETAILVSLIPTWTIETLSKKLNGHNQIIRMIPNAPSLLGNGFNPVCFTQEITDEKKRDLLALFNYWGQCPEVNENHLEAFAVLTGMGPTYLWPQFKKLFELGISFGLSETELNNGLLNMITGSAQLMFNSELSREQVLDLIPVYPLKEDEKSILESYDLKLNGLYQKLESARK